MPSSIRVWLKQEEEGNGGFHHMCLFLHFSTANKNGKSKQTTCKHLKKEDSSCLTIFLSANYISKYQTFNNHKKKY